MFRPGDRVAVMIHRAPDGRDYLVAMALSVYRARGDRFRMTLHGDLLGAGREIRPGPHTRGLSLEELVALERQTRRR